MLGCVGLEYDNRRMGIENRTGRQKLCATELISAVSTGVQEDGVSIAEWSWIRRMSSFRDLLPRDLVNVSGALARSQE